MSGYSLLRDQTLNQYGNTSLDNAPDPRALLIEMIIMTSGRLRDVATLLGLHRSIVYERVYEWGLWPHVNKCRADNLVVQDLKRRLSEQESQALSSQES